jgi:hypothetical protein
MMRSAWRRITAAVGMFLLAACSAEAPPSGGSAQQVAAVHGGCVDAMLRSTCRVMNDQSPAARPSDVIFVAGVGRVDARSYQALREAGDGMCEQVRGSCSQAWDGAPCRTARALWGGPANRPR